MLLSSFVLFTSAVAVWAAPFPSNNKPTAKNAPQSTAVKTTSNGSSPSGWPSQVNDNGKSFGITQNLKTGTSAVETIDGAPALVAKYPKGSYAGAAKPHPGIAGFIVEGTGGSEANLENAREAVLDYEVKFQNGFDYVLAGKLPGLCE